MPCCRRGRRIVYKMGKLQNNKKGVRRPFLASVPVSARLLSLYGRGSGRRAPRPYPRTHVRARPVLGARAAATASGGTVLKMDEVTSLDFLAACPKAGMDNNVEAFAEMIRQNCGFLMEVGWPHCESLEIGTEAHFGLSLDYGYLKSFPCVNRRLSLVFVGAFRFRRMGCGMPVSGILLFSSSGGRIYAYSSVTDIMYIVSECGLEDVVSTRRGLRRVHELYDDPFVSAQDEIMRHVYGYSPVLLPLMGEDCSVDKITEFQAACPRFTCESLRSPDGYFMFGDEHQLNLVQFVPSRAFDCLRAAGFWVLGQGYRRTIVVVNRRCETFALMRNGTALKVSNTVRGFLRDRLHVGMDVKRYAFVRDECRASEVCVGDVVSFACDVRYVLPDDEWLYAKVKMHRDACAGVMEDDEIQALII